MATDGSITTEFLDELYDPKESKHDDLELNMNIATRLNLLDAAMTRDATLQHMGCNQNYSFEVSQSECKPVTNQNSTGTCWLYATLNILRRPFMAKYNLQKFQFNVEYL